MPCALILDLNLAALKLRMERMFSPTEPGGIGKSSALIAEAFTLNLDAFNHQKMIKQARMCIVKVSTT